MRRALLCGCGLWAIAAVGAMAQQPAGPAPSADHGWARATAAQAQTGAAYLVLHGGGGDEVTGFSTPIAASATLHRSMQSAGVMEMRPVERLPLPPGQDLTLAPGGYHVMLMGLRQGLKSGEHFPLTVTFAHAAAVTISVTVERAGAAGPHQPGMDGMSMP